LRTQTVGSALLLSIPLGILSLVAGLCRAATPGAASADRPNVIFIIADDLNREACDFIPGASDTFLTPTLHAMAAEGVVLTELHSPSPVCTPSRYAALTGRYPSRCAEPGFRRQADREGQTVVSFNTHIGPSDATLPKLLREAGYTTGAVGKNHVIAAPGYQRIPYRADPDDPAVRQQMAENAEALKRAFHGAGFDYAEALYHGNPDADGVRALAMHNQEWITDAALGFIEANRAGPFFLYMSTTLPHGPFEAKRNWKADPRVTPEGLLDEVPDVQAARDTIEPRMAEAGVSGWNKPAVLWLDDGVAAVKAKLQELEIADRTIIVFVSDHGTVSKGSVYRRGTNTAGLVWTPGGFPAGSQIAAMASMIDWAPTILDWAGAAHEPGRFDGVSLAGVLRGEIDEVRESLYFEMGYTRGVQKDGFKYIAVRYPDSAVNMPMEQRAQVLAENNEQLEVRGRPLPTTDPTTPFSHLFLIPGGNDAEQTSIRNQPTYFDADQLFDLTADPDEQVNLADDPAHTEMLEDLRRELARYVRGLNDGFGEFDTEYLTD
jgi:arylsulfatase A-like enzyme